MLRNVFLYGALKKAFGPVFKFDVETAGEAFRALNCAFPGRFVAELRQGYYRVVRGNRHTGMPLVDMKLLTDFRLGSADLHIVPVPEGSSAKSRGTIKAVAGVAIIGAAIFFSGGTLAAPLSMMGNVAAIGEASLGMTWGSVATLGVSVALAGVGQMKAAAEKPQTQESVKPAASWSFSGPSNVSEQGGAVPLFYGQAIVGTTTISAAMDIENVGKYQA